MTHIIKLVPAAAASRAVTLAALAVLVIVAATMVSTSHAPAPPATTPLGSSAALRGLLF